MCIRDRSTEQSESQFLAFGRQLLLKGCYHPLEEFFHRLDGVTIESLMRVAQSLVTLFGVERERDHESMNWEARGPQLVPVSYTHLDVYKRQR